MSSTDILYTGGDSRPEPSRSERLRMARERVGLSREDMAELCGREVHAIWRWETGRADPDMGSMRLWAVRTGVELAWLVGSEPIKKRGPVPRPKAVPTSAAVGSPSPGNTPISSDMSKTGDSQVTVGEDMDSPLPNCDYPYQKHAA